MKNKTKRAERLAALAGRLSDEQLADLLEDANKTASPELMAAARVEMKRRGPQVYQLNFAEGAQR